MAIALSLLSILCSVVGIIMLLLSNKILNTCTFASQLILAGAVIAALIAFESPQGWFFLLVSVVLFIQFVRKYRHEPHHTVGA